MAPAAEFDVAIAGAGIVGASIAHHLALRGMRCVVIDATGPSAGASGASDGAVSVASKKPGVVARLATASLVYTRELSAPGCVLANAFAGRPAWFFATAPAEVEALDQLIAKLAALGGPVTVTADGGADLLPGSGPAVRRLVEIRGEGHMTGYSAVGAYLSDPRIARRWPARVARIDADDRGVTLTLPGGDLRAGALVVAAGTASSELVSGLPLRPRAGQLFVTDRGRGTPLPGALTAASYLLAKTGGAASLPAAPVVIDPLATGQFLIGSTREEHGDPHRLDFRAMQTLLRRAVEVWPEVARRRVIRAFTGIRAAVADGLPIVGPLPDAPRVMIATGFEGDGICLSALIGREVAAMLAGEPPADTLAADLRALSPGRFLPPEAGRAFA